MRGFRIKPNLKKIDLFILKAEQVEFFCATQHIDKIRCKREGIKWDQDLADFLEEKTKSYFLVKSNMEYDVVHSPQFDPVIEKLNVVSGPITDKANKCIDHYIKYLNENR